MNSYKYLVPLFLVSVLIFINSFKEDYSNEFDEVIVSQTLENALSSEVKVKNLNNFDTIHSAKKSPLISNIEIKETANNDATPQINEEYKTPEYILKNAITRNDSDTFIDSQLIESLDLNEILLVVDELTYSSKLPESMELELNINDNLNKAIEDYSTIKSDRVGCSDQLCGIVLSSTSKEDVTDAIMKLSSSISPIGGSLNGGLLITYSQDDVYFGFILGATEMNKPVKIR